MEIKTNQFTEISSVERNPSSTVEIQDWLVSYLAELLEIDPLKIDVKIPFNRYGLDSSAAIGLTGDLGDCLGYDLDPTLIYDYPTIEDLAEQLHLLTKGKVKG